MPRVTYHPVDKDLAEASTAVEFERVFQARVKTIREILGTPGPLPRQRLENLVSDLLLAHGGLFVQLVADVEKAVRGPEADG